MDEQGPMMPGDGTTKVLMAIAVIAVVVAAGNLFFNFLTLQSTGYANVDTGQADVQIESAINIRFNVNSLDWGAGFVNGSINAVLDTQTSPYFNENWSFNLADNPTTNSLAGGLEIENYGNAVVDLYLNSSEDVNDFICSADATCTAASPGFEWQSEEIEDSCDATLAATTWTTVTSDLTGDGLLMCDAFDNQVGSNELEVDLRLTVPISAPSGARTTIITATAIEST